MNSTEPLEIRLARLEREALRWRKTARRLRLSLLGLLLLGAGGLGLAAAAAPAVADVLLASRVEIVDDQGNLVAALSSDERGGRLDLWTETGNNVMRFASNEAGGDLNLWNRTGGTVFSAFAAPHGSEFGLWSPSGARVLHATTGDAGGRLEILGTDGRPAFAAASAGHGGSVEVAGGQGQRVCSIRADRGGSGELKLMNADGSSLLAAETSDVYGTSLLLSDSRGRPRVMMRTEERGGALSFANENGKPTLTLGVADPSGGGFVDVANATGTRIFAAGADEDGCGRLDLSNENGQRVFTVDGIPNRGAALGLFTAQGKKAAMFGTQARGGVMNIFNQHEVAVIAAGYSEENLGGAMSIMNGRGLPVVHSASDELGHGRVTVLDVEGKRRRVVQTPR